MAIAHADLMGGQQIPIGDGTRRYVLDLPVCAPGGGGVNCKPQALLIHELVLADLLAKVAMKNGEWRRGCPPPDKCRFTWLSRLARSLFFGRGFVAALPREGSHPLGRPATICPA